MHRIQLHQSDLIVTFSSNAPVPDLPIQSGEYTILWPSEIPLLIQLQESTLFIEGQAQNLQVQLERTEVLVKNFSGQLEGALRDCFIEQNPVSAEPTRLDLNVRDSRMLLDQKNRETYLLHSSLKDAYQGSIGTTTVFLGGERYSVELESVGTDLSSESSEPSAVFADEKGEEIISDSEELMSLFDHFEERIETAEASLSALEESPKFRMSFSRSEQFYRRLYKEGKLTFEELEEKLTHA